MIWYAVWNINIYRGQRGLDRFFIGYTTGCAIRSYHHWTYEFESWSGEACSIWHNVLKFVSSLRQFGGFLRVHRFPTPNKTDRHEITEILFKVALNTVTQTLINDVNYSLHVVFLFRNKRNLNIHMSVL